MPAIITAGCFAAALLLTTPPLTRAAAPQRLSLRQRLVDMSASISASAPDPDRAKASALLQRRSLADCEKAVELLEKALQRTPDDAALCLECAAALNAIMRMKTDSNTLHITKMLDTAENKRVWARHGPRALSLAKQAKAARPSDPEALLAYCDAFFFANSVKGVLAAATTGSGLKFKGNAKELIARCPRLDGGIGHCYLGAFYLMAPWPLKNEKLAKQHLHAAHKIVPSRRNCYYLGVLYYRLGQPREAAPFFRAATQAACNSPSERDFGDFVLAEAKHALQVCEASC